MGALLCLDSSGLFPLRKASKAVVPEALSSFRSRAVSVRRLPELKAWMDKLDKSGKLSADKTWRRYIGSFQYAPPTTLANARTIIIMATPLKISRIAFQFSGHRRNIPIPSGYVDDGNALADYKNMIYRSGIVPEGSLLEWARLPLKQLAVRSGLATYGRNNITYIDDYGSQHQLLAFYSEHSLEDQWGPLRMLRLCKGCSICLSECPTGAIRRDEFVIDPARCITLYNELPDPMPAWIPASAHNSLVGCLRCQLTCPGNEEVIRDQWDLGEVPEAETAALLSGKPDAPVEKVLKERFRRISGGEDLPYIARNLRLVLEASAGAEAT